MKLPWIALLAGVGALVLGGVAFADTGHDHILNVRLPNGQVEQIRYTGDVPPTVTLVPVSTPAPTTMTADPFVMMQQISAEMDAQAAMLLHSVAEMAMQPMPTINQGFPGGLGPITVAAGPGVCMRSVQVTYSGNGQPPHVVSHTSGDCGPAARQPGPAALPASPVQTPAPHTYQVRYTGPGSYAGMIHPVSTLSR